MDRRPWGEYSRIPVPSWTARRLIIVHMVQSENASGDPLPVTHSNDATEVSIGGESREMLLVDAGGGV